MYELFRNALALPIVNHVLASALFGIAFAADRGLTADGRPIAPGSLLWFASILVCCGGAFALLFLIAMFLPVEWDVHFGAAALVFGAIGLASTFSFPGTELVRSTLTMHPFWFVGALVCGRFMVEHYLAIRRSGVL